MNLFGKGDESKAKSIQEQILELVGEKEMQQSIEQDLKENQVKHASWEDKPESPKK